MSGDAVDVNPLFSEPFLPRSRSREVTGDSRRESSYLRGTGGVASDISGRNWARFGDFISGRGHRSSPRQYPMMPVVDPFLESTQAENPRVQRDDSGEPGVTDHISLSSRLPPKVWYILAKTLGIKLSINDRPICATFLHVLTLTTAFLFAIPGAWYTVYDIRSEFSRTTVLIGSVQIVIGFTWACMGVYAHKLAGRLFGNRNFLECVRVHSKTFLKISTSLLTIILGVLVVGVNCYEAAPMFYDKTCQTAQVNIAVCQVFYVGRVSYAVLTLVWNFIVAYVVFSVCRTHTVAMRRFMYQLNLDAKAYEYFCLEQYKNSSERRNQISMSNGGQVEDSWFLWDDTMNDIEEEGIAHDTFLQPIQGTSFHRCLSAHLRHTSPSLSAISRRRSTLPNSTVGGDSHQQSRSNLQASGNSYEDADDRSPGKHNVDQSQVGGNTEDIDTSSVIVSPLEQSVNASVENDPFEDAETGQEKEDPRLPADLSAPAILSNDDLLFSYWKFLRRLSVTSRYLQRWLASWITFVVIWDGYFIIYWTSHQASLIAILQFIVPLLLLLLMCSAYAEVNAEGQRLLKTICPLEERLAVIFYFNQQPLSVKVFSFTVSYNAMMTVILGFSVAFASRMILDEMNRT